MKLSPKKSQSAAAAYWHPDFRDVAALPDLKVVRTSFFVNVVCVTLATIALLFTAYREYEAFSRRAEISVAEESMAGKQARNSELLGLSREFSEMNLRFQEAEKFMQAPFAASELLIALSASLPNHMDFTRVAYGDGVLTLRGTIRGASETASTRVAAYQDVLRQDKLLGTLFPDVSLKSLDRDPRTQGLSFELVLKASSTESAKKKASGSQS